MRSANESLRRPGISQTSGPGFSKTADLGYARRLRTIERLAAEILSRVEQLFRETPEIILAKQSTMLPSELEDNKQYFLRKIEHARNTLKELSNFLPADAEAPDLRGEVSVELMILFVLIDNFRPERMAASGCSVDHEVRHVIQERIEALSLDVINMRERLK